MAGCALMVSAVFNACNDAVETKATEEQHVLVSETEVIKKGGASCNDYGMQRLLFT